MSTLTDRVDAAKGQAFEFGHSLEVVPACFAMTLASELEAAQAKITELENWKAQMLQVWEQIDSQKIATMLGATIGESCFAVINRRVPEVLVELTQSQRATTALRSCLEQCRDALISIEARQHLHIYSCPCPLLAMDALTAATQTLEGKA